MDGDSHVLAWTNLEVDRVRHRLALRRHCDTGLAVKGQADRSRCINLAAATCRLGNGKLDALNLRAARAELVGEFQSNALATDGHLHNLA